MIVAIDGPAGAGKSTVARAVATRCGLTYLDTGALYRAVTLACLRRGVDVADEASVAEVARSARLELSTDAGRTLVRLEGDDVTEAIRAPEIDRAVSAVSAVPAVRETMVALQRALSSGGDVVAEGRDIGTVVFPQAEVKVFLTADAKARARRRAAERGGDADESEVLADIRQRDAIDSTRAVSPLVAAADAHRIDSSDMTVEEVVDAVIALVQAASAVTPGPSGDAAGDGDGLATPARREAGGLRVTQGQEGMRAFAGNAVDEYYEHAMRDFPLPSRAFLCLVVNLVWAVTKLVFPWRIERAELLWDGREAGARGRVVVMNHVSMLDPVVLVIALYHHGIRTRPISKSEFDKVKIVSWALSRFGCIPVERGTADIKAVRRAQRALQRGEYVLIFPEGTRIKGDDEPVTIHGGFALMAQMGRADVQPTAIVGAGDITPRGAHVPRPRRVFLKVGEAITFAGLGVRKRKEQIAEMERVAVERMYELRDELRREHPGKR